MEQRPHPHIQAPGKAGKTILAELETLRDSNRLGLHMFEKDRSDSYPDNANRLLKKNAPGQQGGKATFSLSLLPAHDTGCAMVPYDLGAHVGYLFDLREDQEHPPTILGAHHTTMCSGDDVFDKKMEAAWSQVGLDQMASAYKELNKGQELAPFNELQAHVHRGQVKAIVAATKTAEQNVKGLDDYIRLNAAIVGLEHIEAEGQSPPVVLYHVRAPLQNTFTYLGQTQEELRASARSALQGIAQSRPIMRMIESDIFALDYWSKLEHHLGAEPVDEALTINAASRWR